MAYISINEGAAQSGAGGKQPVKQLKPAGFCSLCCSYCCVLTGGTGVLLLGLFSLALYKHWYWETELQLPELQKDKYTEKSLVFLTGMIIEAVVFVGSVFWVRSVNRKNAAYKAA